MHFETFFPRTYNDGYAHKVSLVLSSTATSGSISGSVFNDVNGDGVKGATETGLSGLKVFVDKNGNGNLDTGENSAISGSTGAYTISGVAGGTFQVREIPSAGF